MQRYKQSSFDNSNGTSRKSNAGSSGGSSGGGKSINYDHVIKMLSIGDSGVGKSCLLLRFCDDEFTPSFISTIGIDYKYRIIPIDGKRIRMNIWDTAGQERFKTITAAYYRGAMGIMLVYDVSDERSFQNVRNWMSNVEDLAAEDVDLILVGNKMDCSPQKRVVSTERGMELAQEYGLTFMETSAKSGENVDAAFTELARMVKKRLIDNCPNTLLSPQQQQPFNVVNLSKRGGSGDGDDGNVSNIILKRLRGSCCTGESYNEST